MRHLFLDLHTPEGAPFARLPLQRVGLHAAGESTEANLVGAADTLYAQIEAALKEEGLVVALDALDFRIAVSRGLIEHDTGQAEVLLPLPVRLVNDPNTEPTDPEPRSDGRLDDFPSGRDGLNDEADAGEEDADA